MKIKNLRKKGKKFLQFTRFIIPYWKIEVLAIGLSQLIVYLGLINPYLTKLVIDNAYGNRDLKLFILLAAVAIAVFLVIGILTSISDYYSRYLKQKVNFDMNKEIISTLHSLDLKFFRDTSGGENLYKINYDIERVTNLITDTVATSLKLFPTFLFTFIIVLFLNWRMALMAFFLGIFFYFHALFFARRRRVLMRQLVIQRQGIFSRLNEMFQKMYLVKAAGKEATEKEKHVDRLSEAMATFFKGLKVQIASGFTSQIISRSIIGAITFYGGYQIIKGDMTLGTLTSIMVYLSRISGFHSQVSRLFQNINLGLISCERLEVILDKGRQKYIKREGKKPARFRPEIKFRNVDFYYYPQQYILKNFNMGISPKQWIGLAGPSGCGKTTVMNLLLGLYWPLRGEVLIDGISIKEIDLNFIKENIGVVPQESYFWNDTIKENLLYFNNQADLEDIRKVVEQVRLTKTLAQQPKKLDTQLGDEACKLSEGEKQRLALARALLFKPKLLILDEALSFVDNEASAFILEEIKSHYSNSSVILITHNPLALRYTDKVVYMKQTGQVIEDSHENLLQNPDYYKLFG